MIRLGVRAALLVSSDASHSNDVLLFWKKRQARMICCWISDLSSKGRLLDVDKKIRQTPQMMCQQNLASTTNFVRHCNNQKTNKFCDNISENNFKTVHDEVDKSNLMTDTNSDILQTLASTEKLKSDNDHAGLSKGLSHIGLSYLKPSLPKKSYNLAAYVSESETLSNLVKLGVNLSVVEANVDAANHIVKMDFENDIQPYLMFLYENKVPDAEIGQLITKNPDIFRESLDDLKVRVNYLKSKRFSLEAVGRLISKAPTLLTTMTTQTDAQLGFLQKEFGLTGDEVRLVATKHPKIVVWSKIAIQDIKMTLKDFLGFVDFEVKQMLIEDPKLYISGRHAIMERFDYLHNTVGLSHKDILLWPSILRTRIFIVRQRYQFLKLVGRDQFDPKKENYVSPKALVVGTDLDFCGNVAKVPIHQFNEFLKTL